MESLLLEMELLEIAASKGEDALQTQKAWREGLRSKCNSEEETRFLRQALAIHKSCRGKADAAHSDSIANIVGKIRTINRQHTEPKGANYFAFSLQQFSAAYRSWFFEHTGRQEVVAINSDHFAFGNNRPNDI